MTLDQTLPVRLFEISHCRAGTGEGSRDLRRSSDDVGSGLQPVVEHGQALERQDESVVILTKSSKTFGKRSREETQKERASRMRRFFLSTYGVREDVGETHVD